MHYRSDIEGLRALAILVVIFYHAGFTFFSGGFIGVDIFFVISGFLITSILTQRLEAGTFDAREFWQKRISRLLPALAAVTIFVLLVGFFIYFPNDYKSVGKQAAVQSLLGSNIFFYHITGYFNPDTAAKPLLHTWSLAIEAQFYLFFPLLMMAAFKTGKSNLNWILSLILIGSLSASIWMTDKSMDAAFFLTPYRIWEFLLGSLIVMLPHMKSRWNEVLSLSGLGMIGYSVTTYTSSMLFPGTAALILCLGAAAIIYSGPQTYLARFLSFKAFVFIGSISYSLYLWHWPIFTMANYVQILPDKIPVKCGLIVLSFLIAVLSWKYIEEPFRYKNESKIIYRYGLAALVFIFALGASAFLYAKTQRPVAGQLNLAKAEKDFSPYRNKCQDKTGNKLAKDKACQTNPEAEEPSFIVWGDSHGDADTPAFYNLSKQYGRNGYVFFKHGCPPIIGYSVRGNKDNKNCQKFNREALAFIERHEVQDIYLIGYWDYWLKDNHNVYLDPAPNAGIYKNEMMSAMQATLNVLKHKNVKVHMLLPPPTMEFQVPRMLAFRERFNLDRGNLFLPVQDYLDYRPEEVTLLINNNPDVAFIDPKEEFCPDGKCWPAENEHPLYYDKHHLSQYGAKKLEAVLIPYFKTRKILRQPRSPQTALTEVSGLLKE